MAVANDRTAVTDRRVETLKMIADKAGIHDDLLKTRIVADVLTIDHDPANDAIHTEALSAAVLAYENVIHHQANQIKHLAQIKDLLGYGAKKLATNAAARAAGTVLAHVPQGINAGPNDVPTIAGLAVGLAK